MVFCAFCSVHLVVPKIFQLFVFWAIQTLLHCVSIRPVECIREKLISSSHFYFYNSSASKSRTLWPPPAKVPLPPDRRPATFMPAGRLIMAPCMGPPMFMGRRMGKLLPPAFAAAVGVDPVVALASVLPRGVSSDPSRSSGRAGSPRCMFSTTEFSLPEARLLVDGSSRSLAAGGSALDCNHVGGDETAGAGAIGVAASFAPDRAAGVAGLAAALASANQDGTAAELLLSTGVAAAGTGFSHDGAGLGLAVSAGGGPPLDGCSQLGVLAGGAAATAADFSWLLPSSMPRSYSGEHKGKKTPHGRKVPRG